MLKNAYIRNFTLFKEETFKCMKNQRKKLLKPNESLDVRFFGIQKQNEKIEVIGLLRKIPLI